MLLWCPMCHARHVDEGDFATHPHHTHACQTCGLTWRPAVVDTVGVAFLPGFKDSPATIPRGIVEDKSPIQCHICHAVYGRHEILNHLKSHEPK